VLSKVTAMSDDPHRYALQCLRLAADFTQLAKDVHNRALETHFLASDIHGRALEIHLLRIAKLWTARAEHGSAATCDREIH
jgi:hypothetical protein